MRSVFVYAGWSLLQKAELCLIALPFGHCEHLVVPNVPLVIHYMFLSVISVAPVQW